MSAVTSLGYVVVSSGDLDGWQSFATDLLGLQVSARTDEALVLRADRCRSRLRVEDGDAEGVVALGWEVAGPAELDRLAARLSDSGFDIVAEGAARAAAPPRAQPHDPCGPLAQARSRPCPCAPARQWRRAPALGDQAGPGPPTRQPHQLQPRQAQRQQASGHPQAL